MIKKKKIIIRVGLLSIILILILIFFPYKQIRCYNGTEFKKSFSLLKFSKVEIGMSEINVIKSLGEPYGKLYWRDVYGKDTINKKYDYDLMYYKPIDWKHYLVKRITIKNHVVIGKVSEYNYE